jgi:hypothetical protein
MQSGQQMPAQANRLWTMHCSGAHAAALRLKKQLGRTNRYILLTITEYIDSGLLYMAPPGVGEHYCPPLPERSPSCNAL